MRPLWQFLSELVPGTNARAEQVNDNLEQIEAAFAEVGNELNRTIRFTNGPVPSEGAFQIAATPAERAGRLLAFNAAGTGLELASRLLNPRGTHLTGTAYQIGDVVQATATMSLYMCLVAHTATVFATDLAASRWALLLDNSAAYQAARAFRIVNFANSPAQLAPGDDVFVDVSAGPVTLVLPASPVITMQSISITHVEGNVVANPITIARNGARIMSLLEDMAVNTPNAALELGYCDSARGWRLVRGV